MRHSLATCPRCGHMLDTALLAQGGEMRCSTCRHVFFVALFPQALRETLPAERPELSVGGGEAVCFYHPGSIVESACDQCGRFLCRLCTLALGARVLCPQCLHQCSVKSDDPRYRLSYFRQDRLALVLALLPFTVSWCVVPALFIDAAFAIGMFFSMIIMVSLVTAPIALFSVFHQWRMAEAAVDRPRARLAVTAVLAVSQAGVWLVGIVGFALMIISEMGAD